MDVSHLHYFGLLLKTLLCERQLILNLRLVFGGFVSTVAPFKTKRSCASKAGKFVICVKGTRRSGGLVLIGTPVFPHC